MLQRYTFLEHPISYILSNSRQMVSGLDKCLGIFYNQNTKEAEALIFDGELNSLVCEDTDFIDKLRDSNKKANWIKPNQVPFETDANQTEQLTFSDEEESSVLELRFCNPIDNKSDVIYFYFKNNIGNFKLSSTDSAMAVTIKEVIQNLIYNQILLLLKASYNNMEVHHKVASNIDFGLLQNEILHLKESNFKQIQVTYSYLLDELTINELTDFSLSKSAVEKIQKQNLELLDVKKLLQDSLEILVNKYTLGDVYDITEHDILTYNKPVYYKSVVEENLDKTIKFLDRYEYAAKLLISKNQKVTGVNIGSTCDPNISAAAISDILKKHQPKIIKLFAKYPERWSGLKQHFRPIKNIQQKLNSETIRRNSA